MGTALSCLCGEEKEKQNQNLQNNNNNRNMNASQNKNQQFDEEQQKIIGKVYYFEPIQNQQSSINFLSYDLKVVEYQYSQKLSELYEQNFDDETIRFIIAKIILLIKHLHVNLHTMLRELRLETVIVTQDGNIKIVNNGRFLEFKNDEKVQEGFEGDLRYIAPEVFDEQSQGYRRSIDFWSLGILVYLLYFKKTPFEDIMPEQTKENIQKKQIIFNEKLASQEAIDLMKKLLEKDPNTRLGGSGIQEIQDHNYFKLSNWNWDQLQNFQVPSPFDRTQNNQTQASGGVMDGIITGLIIGEGMNMMMGGHNNQAEHEQDFQDDYEDYGGGDD